MSTSEFVKGVAIAIVLALVAFGLFVSYESYPTTTISLLALVAVFCLIAAVVPIHWYIALWMAKYDFVFTTVPEGYYKVAKRFGAVRKVLMAKGGYRVDENGNIVELMPGEPPESLLPGGLKVLGWPGIDRIYTRQMKFLKSLPDGSIKSYDVENVDAFYARVDYPYALIFVKCEDKNNLPILGHATLLANVEGPVRSLFATANFYDTMVGLVLPVVRECLEGYTFDELKGQKKEDLDQRVWDELKAKQPDGSDSVIDELCKKYGIRIVALRIVNIDPPEEYRDLTLAKWKAEREADAAAAVARKEAMLTGGTLTLIVDEQIVAMAKHCTLTDEDKKRIRAESLNVLLRERAGKVGGLKDIRVANADGSSFAGGSIAEIVAGVVAAVAASASAKQNPPVANPGSGGSSGKNPGSGRKKKKKKPEEESNKDAVDNAFGG